MSLLCGKWYFRDVCLQEGAVRSKSILSHVLLNAVHARMGVLVCIQCHARIGLHRASRANGVNDLAIHVEHSGWDYVIAGSMCIDHP